MDNYKANVILCPKSDTEKELQIQTRSLREAINSLPHEGVLVKVQAAGICHSDVHLWKGHYKIGKTENDLLRFSERPGMGYPIVPGHEIAGLVHFMGETASSAGVVAVGDRVVVYPWIGCEQCPVCTVGDSYLCPVKSQEIGICFDGGYAEYVKVIHYRFVLRLPENIPFTLGALLPCSGLTSYSALRKCMEVAERVKGWKRDIHVAVIGLGGLAMFALKLLPFCLGGEGVKIVGLDINSRKLKIVKDSWLADHTFLLCSNDTTEQQVEKYITEFQLKPSIVLDFVNSTDTFSFSVQLLERAGIHVMIGLHGGLGELKLPLASLSESVHVGNYVGSTSRLEELIKLVSEQKIKYPFLKHYQLNEATKALEDLEQGTVDGRAVLVT